MEKIDEMFWPDESIKEMLLMAEYNFNNVRRLIPGMCKHPIYSLAMAQLKDAIEKYRQEHRSKES
jgi:hypothetical protein